MKLQSKNVGKLETCVLLWLKFKLALIQRLIQYRKKIHLQSIDFHLIHVSTYCSQFP